MLNKYDQNQLLNKLVREEIFNQHKKAVWRLQHLVCGRHFCEKYHKILIFLGFNSIFSTILVWKAFSLRLKFQQTKSHFWYKKCSKNAFCVSQIDPTQSKPITFPKLSESMEAARNSRKLNQFLKRMMFYFSLIP